MRRVFRSALIDQPGITTDRTPLHRSQSVALWPVSLWSSVRSSPHPKEHWSTEEPTREQTSGIASPR
ncbi:hypothetical protein H6F46_17805 [Limnothrix sp. FACHB-1083]|uniref:hypothetical protein n=1 Tax=unclassified Limnothrix TaxID=2632864 RepID=UPI00167FF60A|nr:MULTISPECIES: hypothetical protein [unclassified Limnothrix]MBD2162547.1 hypothetical protein [Limnothrix sp. FACHB-1083]MBD2193603.1 hypothetical protein [Limnothrix sp. FACHB-1088]